MNFLRLFKKTINFLFDFIARCCGNLGSSARYLFAMKQRVGKADTILVTEDNGPDNRHFENQICPYETRGLSLDKVSH